ncbi:MAG: restriction endonuclease subunit R [Chloroflexota bacterium]
MAKKISARNVTLNDLKNKFALQLVREPAFFPEWSSDLPEVTEAEKQFLNQVQAGFFNLMDYPPVLEDTVKIAVLSPLVQLAGLLLPPYYIKTEESISITAVDDSIAIDGKIDVLVLQDRLWMIVIESKQASFSILTGLAQILSYMLANTEKDKPVYGMITTGGSFIFVKLLNNKYSTSRVFELINPGNELYTVLSILKRLAQIASQGITEQEPYPHDS